MKIMVAIPVYDGKLQVQTVTCLLFEQSLARELGHEICFQFLPNCSHAAMGRNQMAQGFMDSDCDRLVFIDADITFEAGSIIKIAHQPFDFCGGAYRYKMEPENYPVGWLTGNENENAKQGDLLQVATLPGGFLSLSRKVFEDLKAAHPEREYEHFGRKFFCWFQMLYKDGFLYGEDSYFCKEWTNLGNQIWMDPDLTLTHWDFNKPYVGNISKWLRNR